MIDVYSCHKEIPKNMCMKEASVKQAMKEFFLDFGKTKMIRRIIVDNCVKCHDVLSIYGLG